MGAMVDVVSLKVGADAGVADTDAIERAKKEENDET